MSKFKSLLVAASIFLVTTVASAFEADFTVSIKKVDILGANEPRLVANSNFKNVQLDEFGSFTIYYDVIEATTDSTVYTGSATINVGEKRVVEGNINNGKIIMTYNPKTDSLKTRFIIKLSQASQYNVSASDGLWAGTAQIYNTYLF